MCWDVLLESGLSQSSSHQRLWQRSTKSPHSSHVYQSVSQLTFLPRFNHPNITTTPSAPRPRRQMHRTSQFERSKLGQHGLVENQGNIAISIPNSTLQLTPLQQYQPFQVESNTSLVDHRDKVDKWAELKTLWPIFKNRYDILHANSPWSVYTPNTHVYFWHDFPRRFPKCELPDRFGEISQNDISPTHPPHYRPHYHQSTLVTCR